MWGEIMKNKNTWLIVLGGMVVVLIFTAVVIKNIPKTSSFDANIDSAISLKIESLDILDNKAILYTTDDIRNYCAKTTISTPNIKSLCWKSLDNNKAEINIYSHKKYYIWIMDDNNSILGPISVTER